MSRYLPIALFGLIALFLAIGLTRDPSAIPSEMIDQEVPAFALTELRDEAVAVQNVDLQGQISLLNVFGSWCVACLQEHPMLMQIAAEEEVVLIGLNWRDSRAEALAWLDDHGDPYQTVIFDPESELVIELGVTGAPETFVIDASGHIRFKYAGPITPAVWAQEFLPILISLSQDQEGNGV